MFSPFDLDRQIEGNLAVGIKDDLIHLAGLHPRNVAPGHGGMNVRPQVTPGKAPARGKIQDQEITGPE